MSRIAPEEEFFLRLSACYQEVHRIAGEVFAREGLSVPQYNLMRIVQNTPGITANEARERLLVTAPSLAQLAGELERKKWIARGTDVGDARRRPLSLTPAGRQVLMSAQAALRQRIRELKIPKSLFSSLSDDLSSLLTSLPSHGNR
jgi:DNA-binding MarR family transcriptional regulator